MLLLLLLLSLSLTPQSGSLEIESLSVPSYVVSGNSAIMSCYYSVPDDRLPELDIKWYHANSPAPFLVNVCNISIIVVLKVMPLSPKKSEYEGGYKIILAPMIQVSCQPLLTRV